MSDWYLDPPDYPQPPECCGDEMECFEDGVCLCSHCGLRTVPAPEWDPGPEDFADVELPDDFWDGPAHCPHGKTWGDCDDPRPEEPANDEEAINIYFEDHENDSLTTEASECESPLGPSEGEVTKALFKRDFVESLRAAMDVAGGKFSWDQLKRMTLEETCDMLAHNGIRFACLNHRERTDALAQYTAAAKLLISALPHLK